MVLPSIEEGFGLVCVEAIGSDCVPLVSDACTDECVHERNSLVHAVGDVEALAGHFTALHRDRGLLARLRQGCREAAPQVTWTAAGERLLEVYDEVVAGTRTAAAAA
jgi:glycosyltransferase involved in cell wall biosynthesis